MSHSPKDKDVLTRRDALKTLAAVTGAVTLASLPKNWQTPVIEVGALPAHAQTSPCGEVGSLSVSATWSPTGHTDLIIEEPTGELVHPHFFGNGPTVTHGGNSDGGESASIPAGGAANGVYTIYVGEYDLIDRSNVRVTITTEACTYIYSRPLDAFDAWVVATVTYPGGTVTEVDTIIAPLATISEAHSS